MSYIEKLILAKVAGALIDAGLPISVDYNEGEPELVGSTDLTAIETAAFAVDECWLLVNGPDAAGKYESFVYFIWGNGNCGWDCVSDYSTRLEAVLEPVFAWIEQNADGA